MDSRRDFLSKSVLGLGASVLGLSRPESPAESTETTTGPSVADDGGKLWQQYDLTPRGHHSGTLALKTEGEPARPLHIFHAKIGVGRSTIDLYGFAPQYPTLIFDIPHYHPEMWYAMLDGERMDECPEVRADDGFRAYMAPYGHRLESLVFEFRPDDPETRDELAPTVDLKFPKLRTMDECGLRKKDGIWETEFTTDERSQWNWPGSRISRFDVHGRRLVYDFNLPISFVALYAGLLNVPYPIQPVPTPIKTNEFGRSVFVGDVPKDVLPARTTEEMVTIRLG